MKSLSVKLGVILIGLFTFGYAEGCGGIGSILAQEGMGYSGGMIPRE